MTGDGTNKLTGNEIREKFLQFFESKGHRRVRSSSLVPHGDATLLFTNAGMNQFKDVFLGLEKRDYTRATTAQKCVRAGGKHNDLENVGFTKRHHTFFEMLGNFSFGDYYKEEAIAYAWELLTSSQWFNIPVGKMYFTVFGGADLGSNQIAFDHLAVQSWEKVGAPTERIVRISGAEGLKENFWTMGDTGPCGPCSEIHYDMGPAASEEDHPDCKFPCDCGRYVEIWNLVFMQFNRDSSGTLTPLPKPCVDTGMGLERVAAVLENVLSNYETDLFTPLIERAAQLLDRKPLTDSSMRVIERTKQRLVTEADDIQPSYRVIADHSRAATFLISDGVVPSNEGRGYVLRKIIRRALLHVRFLGGNFPFLSGMAEAVRREMKEAYPELYEHAQVVQRVLDEEERRFAHTLEMGVKEVYQELAEHLVPIFQASRQLLRELNAQLPYGQKKDQEDEEMAKRLRVGTDEQLHEAVRHVLSRVKGRGFWRMFPGEKAFHLYDTYGVQRDLIEVIMRDLGATVNWAGFEKAMEEQKTRARASWKGGAKEAANPAYTKLAETFKTEPDFYFGTSAKDCRIEAIFRSAGILPAAGAEQKEPAGSRRYESVPELKAGENGEVVLNRTSIYAESGGQVADTGAFYDNSESQLLAEVTGAFYPVAGLVAHKVVARETLRVGDRVAVVADAERRARIIRNHSGTHLVNAALRNILGTHVKQAGSLNAPERLRFDFSHFAHVDTEELRDIEQQVNDEIRLNTEIETNVTSLEEALASGALAFFGDKYPEHNVRVVTIPDPRAARGFYSKELCGGTHVQHVGDIGVLKIVSEESVAAGVRRIEAVTGIGALEHYQQQAEILRQVASKLNVGEDGILAQVEKLSQTAKQLEKELEAQKRKGALSQIDELAARVQMVKGVKVIAAEVENVDREGLRQLVDSLRQKLGSGVVALGMPEDGKVALIAGVTKDLTAKIHAGKLIQALAKRVGGSGGGRPDLAEAGGKDTAGLKMALDSVPSLIEPLL
jgi:alanyl-tRNA synthetase